MPYIKNTDEAIESLRQLPPAKHDPHALRRREDGHDVWLDEEVIQHLDEKALDDETVSDTIIRLAAFCAARGRLM